MRLYLENFSINFEVESNKVNGILFYTPKGKDKTAVANFSGNRFDIYKTDIILSPKNIEGFKNRMNVFLTMFEDSETLIENNSLYTMCKTKDITGYFSIIIQFLLELNLLVYTNNDLRYNSKVTGKLLLIRLGFNILQDMNNNYQFLQTKIIPTNKVSDHEDLIKKRLGHNIHKVSAILVLDDVIQEKNYTLSDLKSIYKNYR